VRVLPGEGSGNGEIQVDLCVTGGRENGEHGVWMVEEWRANGFPRMSERRPT
jgi:hypothetical protein